MSRPKKDARQRFESYVDRGAANECWNWTGTLFADGYGALHYEGRPVRAHRLMLFFEKGYPLNDKRFVLHSCDNPRCVNPSHLSLGLAADNIADMVAKGRHASQRKTHCPHGHDYSEANTWNQPRADGRTVRRCRTCVNAAQRRRRKDAHLLRPHLGALNAIVRQADELRGAA